MQDWLGKIKLVHAKFMSNIVQCHSRAASQIAIPAAWASLGTPRGKKRFS
jgi:hypothetical protein